MWNSSRAGRHIRQRKSPIVCTPWVPLDPGRDGCYFTSTNAPAPNEGAPRSLQCIFSVCVLRSSASHGTVSCKKVLRRLQWFRLFSTIEAVQAPRLQVVIHYLRCLLSSYRLVIPTVVWDRVAWVSIIRAAQLWVTEQIRRPRWHAVGVLVGLLVGLFVSRRLSVYGAYFTVSAT